jgi:CRISPR-associated protein Cst2
VSLTPWSGDVTFNAASPGATPSAQKKGANPVPYGTEIHATRYQYGIAMTPERLRDPARAAKALRTLACLRTVAGNHGRFLFDFAPDTVVLRVTDDPAPRLLYCFESDDGGKTVEAPSLVQRVAAGDIPPNELILGGAIATGTTGKKLKAAGASVFEGVKAAIEDACKRINAQFKVKE